MEAEEVAQCSEESWVESLHSALVNLFPSISCNNKVSKEIWKMYFKKQ